MQSNNHGSTPQPQPGQQSVSLTALNKQLTLVAMPILSKERANAVLRIAPREKFINAVFAAHADLSAKQYVTHIFHQAGIFEAEKRAPIQALPQEHRNTAPQAGIATAPVPPVQQSSMTPPAPTTASPAYQGESRNEHRTYNENFHVYGGKAALCFEADTTRSDQPTIAIDGAATIAPRTYDWKNKLRIQLTRQELPEVAAVLIGARGKCSFKSHGPQKNKGFEIERQDGGKVFVKVYGGNGQGAYAVPIMANDAFYVTSLVLRQLMAATGLQSIADVTALLWATHGQR